MVVVVGNGVVATVVVAEVVIIVVIPTGRIKMPLVVAPMEVAVVTPSVMETDSTMTE